MDFREVAVTFFEMEDNSRPTESPKSTRKTVVLLNRDQKTKAKVATNEFSLASFSAGAQSCLILRTAL